MPSVTAQETWHP